MIKKIIIFISLSMSLFFLSGCEQKEQIKTQEQNKTTKTSTTQDIQDPMLVETGIVTAGAKLYQKEMQKACNMSGYALARKMSKEEWKVVAENGKLAEAIKNICPDIKFKNSWTPDIYEYLQKNAMSSKS